MKKSDLLTGMRVEIRNGTIYIVLLNTVFNTVAVGSRSYFDIDNHEEDLTCKSMRNLDIIKVYNAPFEVNMLNINIKGTLLWERAESVITVDGVEYSEFFLRSIIKKAH